MKHRCPVESSRENVVYHTVIPPYVLDGKNYGYAIECPNVKFHVGHMGSMEEQCIKIKCNKKHKNKTARIFIGY